MCVPNSKYDVKRFRGLLIMKHVNESPKTGVASMTIVNFIDIFFKLITPAHQGGKLLHLRQFIHSSTSLETLPQKRSSSSCLTRIILPCCPQRIRLLPSEARKALLRPTQRRLRSNIRLWERRNPQARSQYRDPARLCWQLLRARARAETHRADEEGEWLR
jgi:hypothetical protein